MKIKITKQLPEYSISNKDKNIVVVEFPNCISTSTNKSFKWVPTYEQLNEIEKALAEIEIESWGSVAKEGESDNLKYSKE